MLRLRGRHARRPAREKILQRKVQAYQPAYHRAALARRAPGKEAKKPAPKEKPKKSFLSDVEDLGRKMGYGGYGQMMAVIRARCQRSGLSVRSEFCHLKFVYEKEHCHD